MKAATKNFRFGQFTVTVPASATRWAKKPSDELCEVLDSVRAVYSNMNAALKRAHFEPTSEAIRTDLQRKISISKSDSPMKTWELLNDRSVKEQVLWFLRFQRFRNWNASPIASAFARAVAFAAMDGDEIFFRRLGRILEEKAVPFKPPAKRTPLADLLLEHWVSREGLCFCWFSDKALTELLAGIDGRYSQDAVRKVRERLRLRKLRRPLLRSVRKDGARIICE